MRRNISSTVLRTRVGGVMQRIGRALNSRFAFLPNFPTYGPDVRRAIWRSGDPVRYATLALATQTIQRDDIPGSMAEVGVYRGETSRFLRAALPHRRLYLFDTFEGFPEQDLEVVDSRFRDVDVGEIARSKHLSEGVVIRKGYFPETAKGLESERFSLVLLDLDLYKPTLAGLGFFYPRLAPGGYLMLHDYNSPESNRGVSRALKEFMVGVPEAIVEIPDRWGSVMFRKSR